MAGTVCAHTADGILHELVELLHQGAGPEDFAALLAQAEDLPHTDPAKSGLAERIRMGMAVCNRLDLWQQRESGMLAVIESARDLSSRLHLDELLQTFVTEFRRCGGPALNPDRLRRHTLLYAAAMGVAWLLDVPALISARFGASVPGDRTDPRIKDDESVRAPLQMLSNLLSQWEHRRIGELLDAALAEACV